MTGRSKGYCENCNSNVVHVRSFHRRLAYFMDRITGSFLAKFGIGPWQCVDCGYRRLRLLPSMESARKISDRPESVDASVPVGNFLKTEHSLTHATTDADRFSEKYRIGIVEKLLKGTSTFSKVCSELSVSEIELQRWIKDYLQLQLDNVVAANSTDLISTEYAGVSDHRPVNWTEETRQDTVIESTAVRKPR